MKRFVPNKQAFARRAALAALALLALAPLRDGYAEPDSPQIVFLHLRATETGFELLDAQSAPGLLRVPHYESKLAGLHFEVRGRAQQVLFQDVCPEPTIRRLEYEDPDRPGHILTKQVAASNTEFTIRVPYFADAQTIRFYRHSTVAAGVSQPDSTPQLIAAGEVTLSAAGQ